MQAITDFYRIKKIIFIINLFIVGIIFLSSCAKNDKSSLANTSYGGNARSSFFGKGNFSKSYIMFFPILNGNDSLRSVSQTRAVTAPLVDGSNLWFGVSDRTLVCVRQNELIKKIQIPENCATNLALGKESTVYGITQKGELFSVLGENVKVVTTVFSKKTKFPFFADPLIVSEGIVVAQSGGEVVKLRDDNTIQWKYETSQEVHKIISSSPDDQLFFATTSNSYTDTDSLISLRSDGTVRWKLSFYQHRLLRGPIYSNGSVFVVVSRKNNDGNRLYYIAKIDAISGAEQWKKEFSMMPQSVSADDEGNIYVATNVSGVGERLSLVYKISSQGEQLWQQRFSCDISAPILVCSQNCAFIAAQEKGTLFCILSKETGELQAEESLSQYPFLNLLPAVDSKKNILYVSTEKLGYLLIGESALMNFLP